jgi:hypothetical protein
MVKKIVAVWLYIPAGCVPCTALASASSTYARAAAQHFFHVGHSKFTAKVCYLFVHVCCCFLIKSNKIEVIKCCFKTILMVPASIILLATIIPYYSYLQERGYSILFLHPK